MKLVIYLCIFLFAIGCTTQRDVLNEKGKIRLLEKSTIERKMPGDRVYLPFPGTPKERPKNNTTTYTSPKGTKVNTTYDSSGNVSAVDIDCPEITEFEQKESEFSWDYKNKESQRTHNIEMGKLISKTLIWIAAMFAGAWLLRGTLDSILSKVRRP